jgi:hypothetical protein
MVLQVAGSRVEKKKGNFRGYQTHSQEQEKREEQAQKSYASHDSQTILLHQREPPPRSLHSTDRKQAPHNSTTPLFFLGDRSYSLPFFLL